MDMANIAKLVLFISACASLFGLGLFLFRDQIFSQSDASTPARRFWVTIWSACRHSSMGGELGPLCCQGASAAI
jgi:hypothetical protein